MRIELQEITVRELTDGYADKAEEGVTGYGGRLDIRPPYQREFIYKDAQREAVITTVRRGFPLNVMYWAKREDGRFEVIDGQQRTISLCQYVTGEFSVRIDNDLLNFYNLTDERRKQILDYRLMVYVCEGTDQERLDWFRIINIAGVKLEDQELRNAVYAGPWVSDARRYFSKKECAATEPAKIYLTGSAIRQKHLETVIKWISDGKIEEYMAQHQHDANAKELWNYFENVIKWVKATFPYTRKKIMPGVDWGYLYNRHGERTDLDPAALEEEVKRLICDDEVTNKSGIYAYLLTGYEKSLSLRAFTDNQKLEAYERQAGICRKCGKQFDFGQMQGDHIVPWSKGGRTVAENCQMLCRRCNGAKSDK